MTNTNEDRVRALASDLAHLIIPAAAIFAETQDHIDDLRTKAADRLLPLLSGKQALERERDGLKWIADLYDGAPTAADVGNELADYAMILDNVGKVYCHVTGGRISKANTLASAVIAVADDYFTELVEEAVKDTAEASLTAAQERAEGFIRSAFIAGCEAVQANYRPDPDPEFGEAADDYVASVRALLTPTPRSLQGPGIGGGS